jgi:8-oxo-dGTP pyrophosphatase MutT (NUDIX family)
MSDPSFLARVSAIVDTYLEHDAGPHEFLSLLRWQIGEGQALDSRETYPGHVTMSALILSPDAMQTLLIDHKTLKRWLQPGGHYEAGDDPAAPFWHSARREAVEETGIAGLRLHPWHRNADRPFVIDSHDVPGKAARGERPHVHHDLQYLFIADPASPLIAQLDEVAAARWHPVAALGEVAPKAVSKLARLLPA